MIQNDELYLYSNSLPGELANLSYERIFGKLIALKDTMAIIIGRQNQSNPDKNYTAHGNSDVPANFLIQNAYIN